MDSSISGASGAAAGSSGSPGSDAAPEATTPQTDAGAPASAGVLTNRYDNSRTGVTTSEILLTPASVKGGKFGLLFSAPVDGTVQAQPLVVPGLTIQGKVRNVLYVATENNSVFAFDADATGAALWKKSLGTPFTTGNADGTSPVFGCQDLFPVVGINSTPVIDAALSTIYLLAKTSVSGVAHQSLHALDLVTGAERAGSPVEITASVPGSGMGSANGQVPFDPRIELNRAGLLLQNGAIYVSWASHCDVTPWHGWVIAYDQKSLAQVGVYNTTPNGNAGGIWQSGMGLSGDGTSVYFVSGNGDFDTTGAHTNTANKGMSVGRLTLGSGGLSIADSYTAGNAAALNKPDVDLTTAAVLGPGTNYAYMGGKDSSLRVLNRANLGGFHEWTTGTNLDQVVQTISLGGGHVHGSPVFWRGSKVSLFVWNESNPLKAFGVLASGQLTATASANGSIGYMPVHPGSIITVSSNGTTPATGILWAATVTPQSNSNAAWHGIVPGRLYAFEAGDITQNLWNSDTNASDSLGLFAKFSPPVVANGKVYVGTATTTNMVRVYGLHP